MNIKELKELIEKPIWHWLGTKEEVEKDLELKEEANRIAKTHD